MEKSYKHLVGKLNTARKKYYLLQLLMGVIILFSISTACIFVLSFAESIVYFSVSTKTVFVYVFSFVFIFLMIGLVFIPGLKWFGITKTISNRSLSKIISSHFTQIQDKLINLTELIEINESEKNDLVQASINQKSDELISFDFEKAISFSFLKRRFYFLIVGFLFLVIVNFSLNNSIASGLIRLAKFETEFYPPAGFSFNLLSKDLEIKRGSNFLLKVSCEGKEVPEMVFVNISGIDYLMQQTDDYFEFELKHINNSFSFYFTDKLIKSERYQFKVLPNPIILDYQVNIDPPSYTGLKNETLENIGDFKVPFGSNVNWKFETAEVDFLSMRFETDSVKMEENEISYQFFKDENYHISIGNEYFSYYDLLSFDVSVLPDYYPEIELVQLKDSLDFSRFFFKGSIFDDYGFHQLSFHVIINQLDTIFDLPIIKQLNEQEFYYTFNFKELVKPGQTAHYYFEVADNDPFNKYKRTSSKSFQFSFPKNSELLDFENESIAELEVLMEKSYQISKDIKESIEELIFKNFSGNSTNWEKQQLANEIVNKKNQLDNILEQIQEKNQLMNQFMNSFSEEKLEIIEKQKEVEQLLEEVLSDELKELFEEFNKLARDFKSDDFNKMNDKSKLALDDLSKQLERNLQVLKRMKVEQKMERLTDFLNDLAESEWNNSKELENTRNFEKTIQSENENRSSFKNVQEEIDQIFELNDQLKKPLNIPSFDNRTEQIQNQFEKIIESLAKKRKNRSVDQIEKNSEMLKSFSNSMTNALEENREKQNYENIHNIRQILDNLVYLSLEQENLFTDLNTININDPLLNQVIDLQNKLIDQTKHVKDSLYALSNRTAAIGSVINNELIDLEFSMTRSKEDLTEDRVSSAKKFQQSSITALNNMAVFLNEVLRNMEEQMANSMPGDQQCDKPGQKGKESFNMLKETQESLKQQLQQMIEQMKSGESQNLSEQLGKTLSQQEMMQQMIRDLINSEEIGSSSKEQLKQINQLIENSKIDLINKQISQQTINRQNLILDRLLKAEKAEIEREIDDERDSKTAEEKFYSNPAAFFEYKRKETKFDDQIYRKKYQLRKFYQEKYREYINKINEKD